MGNAIPISEVRDDVVTAYRQEILWQSEEMLKPFTKMFERRKVLSLLYAYLMSYAFLSSKIKNLKFHELIELP